MSWLDDILAVPTIGVEHASHLAPGHESMLTTARTEIAVTRGHDSASEQTADLQPIVAREHPEFTREATRDDHLGTHHDEFDPPVGARFVERPNDAASLERLLAERQTLAMELFDAPSTSKARELELLDWRIDRIRDRIEPLDLSTIDAHIEKQEALAAQIQAFVEQLDQHVHTGGVGAHFRA